MSGACVDHEVFQAESRGNQEAEYGDVLVTLSLLMHVSHIFYI